jgi:hypothetical protein
VAPGTQRHYKAEKLSDQSPGVPVTFVSSDLRKHSNMVRQMIVSCEQWLGTNLDFKDKLVVIPPRDRSGPRSSDRFVFQQSWALCKLMALHEAQGDYVLTFDHHEDVTQIDSEQSPSQIKGFQIKTKQSGNWTIRAFLKQETGEGDPPGLLPSILGKLYTLKLQFPGETTLLQFVSNAPVSAKLKSGPVKAPQKHIDFNDLDEETKTNVCDQLKTELQLTDPPSLTSLLEFHVSDLPLQGHDTHTRGRIVEFLQGLYPDRSFRVVPIYRALLSEIAVRNNNQEPVSTYEDLVKLKSISRSQFDKILATVGVKKPDISWDMVEQRLNSEFAPLPLVQGLRREWETVSINRLSRVDLVQLRLRQAIEKSCSEHSGLPKLIEYIETVYSEINGEATSLGFSEMYTKAFIILSIYES